MATVPSIHGFSSPAVDANHNIVSLDGSH
ncbi:MAG: hypothetical protein FD157_4060, partial [Rhodocyclaceae bacterium]